MVLNIVQGTYRIWSISLSLLGVVVLLPLTGNGQTNSDIRHSLHDLKKGGWKCVGTETLEQMLNNSIKKQQEMEMNGMPVFLTAEGSAIADTRDEAQGQALEIARIQFAGLLQSQISASVRTSLMNNSVSDSLRYSIQEIIQSSSNIFLSRLPYLEPEWLVFRLLPSGKTEVGVRVFYSRKAALIHGEDLLTVELSKKLKLSTAQLNELIHTD